MAGYEARWGSDLYEKGILEEPLDWYRQQVRERESLVGAVLAMLQQS